MRVPITVLMLTILLSGCAQEPVPEDGNATTSPPATHQIRLAERVEISLPMCTPIEAFFALEIGAAAAHVPDGFAPAIEDGRVMGLLGGLSCDGLVTERALFAILVRPEHESLMAEGNTNYFWEPEHYLLNGTAFANATIALGATPTIVEAVTNKIDGTSVRLEVELPTGSHTITGTGLAAEGPVTNAFGHFREYFAAEGGYAYLEASFGATQESGVGPTLATVRTAPDTVARELVGAESQAPMLFGNAPYADAALGFVPWPPA